VVPDSLRLPISNEEALRILFREGFELLDEDDVNVVEAVRDRVGLSRYRRGAKPSEAPAVFDCSSLVKWAYGQRGIWLPRRSIQQRELGEEVAFDDIVAGDVVFVSGWIDYYRDDPQDGVGHVGIYTDEGNIIHAANSKVGVVASPLDSFLKGSKLRGIRRYIPQDVEVLTFLTPPEREVEIADDIRWIVLQSLKK